jgi:FKBP-type peptidyl-prolyl cis-trans isomerase FkpA
MRIARLLPVLLVLMVGFSAVMAEPATLETEEDKIFYSFGLALSRNLSQFELTEAELAKLKDGLTDGVLGRDPLVPLGEYASKIDAKLQERTTEIRQRVTVAGATSRAEAAKEPGAEKTDSGLIYRELEPGDGASPAATDTVKIHYHGTLADGTVFDSSLEKDPATFGLGGVIGCFSEGLQKMTVGGKSKLTCPPEIAYGERGSPPKIGPGATLVFEVELLEIVGQSPSPEPAATPEALP